MGIAYATEAFRNHERNQHHSCLWDIKNLKIIKKRQSNSLTAKLTNHIMTWLLKTGKI